MFYFQKANPGGDDRKWAKVFSSRCISVIFAIALLVFGPKKLPELGKGLGEAIRGFKDALKSGDAIPPAKPTDSKALPEAKGSTGEPPTKAP